MILNRLSVCWMSDDVSNDDSVALMMFCLKEELALCMNLMMMSVAMLSSTNDNDLVMTSVSCDEVRASS